MNSRGERDTLKRGKGSQKKAKVLVMASFDKVSLQETQGKKHKTKSKVKYIKMKVIEDLEATTINRDVVQCVDADSTVHTDEYTSYKKLPEIIQNHHSYNLQYDESDKVLPWVHRAITNSKNLLKAIHHCVWPHYLQNYLDEFCYKGSVN